MKIELMSPDAFKWFITFLTGGLAGAWVIYDSLNLTRLMRSATVDRADAVYRDKRFGYVMGIAIGLVGIIGCLLFHDVL
jgi:hypothetical protein